MTPKQKLFWSLGSAIAGIFATTLIKHQLEKRLGPSNGVPHPLLADTLSARLLAVTLAFLPTPNVKLGRKDVAFQAAMGGPELPYLPEGHSPAFVVADYLLGKAGWPKTLVNRREDDKWAPGEGFKLGEEKAKLFKGARERGWLVVPAFARKGDRQAEIAGVPLGEAFKIEPGDFFAAGAGDDPTSAGVVLSVAEADGNRPLLVHTAEGWLDRGESVASWRTRTYKLDGRFGAQEGSRGPCEKLLWIVRPT